jgi:excisionase family DNA binding protein
MDQLMGTEELAAWLNCGKEHVYTLVGQGMPHFRLGIGKKARYRFSKEAVEEWLTWCKSANAVSFERHVHRPSRVDDLFGERQYIGVREDRIGVTDGTRRQRRKRDAQQSG